MKRVVIETLITYVVMAAICGVLWLVQPPFLRPVLAMLDGGGEVTFAYPHLLLLSLLAVPLVLTAWSRPRRRVEGTMAFTRTDLVRSAPKTLRVRLRFLPVLLRGLAAIALVLALARPQSTLEERVEAEGIDIYVALDMSGSMQAIDMNRTELEYALVQGLVPMNRFDVARGVLHDFVVRRGEKPWTDRIGMVIFARHAFLQFPLTADYSTILWLLERLALNDIDASQTAIGNAIGRATLGLLDSPATSKIIILITDGDERGGNVSALAAAQVAADQSIQVYPILVGREGPVLVPAERTHFGFGQNYEEREYPVDPELMQSVADSTGGRYFRAENREELETTLEEIIAEYEKTQLEESIKFNPVELFYPFLFAGVCLLGLELLLRYGVFRKFP